MIFQKYSELKEVQKEDTSKNRTTPVQWYQESALFSSSQDSSSFEGLDMCGTLLKQFGLKLVKLDFEHVHACS